MSDLVLYNYDLSPFSEKIRKMLGHADLSWQSVLVRPMPPRPELAALAGGYRKIPVAQIGADVFCDTKTIAREIARLGNKPLLDLENCPEEAQEFSRRADLDVFFAIVIASGAKMLPTLIKKTSVLDTLRFLKDRIGFARKAKIKPISSQQAKELIEAHIAEMESLLTGNFLFGNEPCAADFSAYHSLWFASGMAGKTWWEDAPRVRDWYARMQGFGNGAVTKITAEQALDTAKNAQPAALDAHLDTEEAVTVAPADYARDPVKGVLVGESEHGWVLQREHPRVGSVNLHFPKAGYELNRKS